MERFPLCWGKKLGLNPSRAAAQQEEMLQGESKSEEQLGELSLFSLKKWRLRKVCEVVQVSFSLSEGQDSPFQPVLTSHWQLGHAWTPEVVVVCRSGHPGSHSQPRAPMAFSGQG